MTYKIKLENSRTNITIPEKQTYDICEFFMKTEGKKTITINQGAHLNYLAIIENSKVNISIQTAGRLASSEIDIITIAKNKQISENHIQSKLLHSESKTNTNITSFIGHKGVVKVEGGVYIGKRIQKVAGFLHEKNIILDDEISIKALPMLDVHSNNVQAAHGASIEKIDNKKIFYLCSKGLDKKTAVQLTISGLINNIINKTSAIYEEEKQEQHQKLIQKILE